MLRLAAAWLVLVAISACAVSPPHNAEGSTSAADAAPALRVGIIGDQTGTDDLDAAYVWLGRGVEALNGRGLDLVLHVGDLVESSFPEDRVRADFAHATGLLNRLDAPWMLTPGDHDINPPERVSNSPDRSREALFLELLKSHDPALGDKFYRSRMIKGWRVISLYSHDHLHADPRWGVTYLARLSDAQIEWLQEELRDAMADEGIIVLIHQPLWYNWAGWSQVHQMLASASVSLVISGHTHYPQIEPPIDGITYMTVGATGGSTKHGSVSAGDVHHVSELTINAEGIFVEAFALTENGREPFAISPRPAMDRVQAVDVMLGSSRFAPRPQSTLPPEGCRADVRWTLPPLGNPIDVPLTVDIHLPDGFTDARFRTGLCTLQTSESCEIPPAKAVIFSNNSSVALSSEGGASSFEATMQPGGNLPTEPVLLVRTRFAVARQTYTLERNLPAAISCANDP